MDAIWAGPPSCADCVDESSSEFSSESAPTLRRRFISCANEVWGSAATRYWISPCGKITYLVIASCLSQLDSAFAAAGAELFRRETAVLKVFSPLLHDVVAACLAKDGHLDDGPCGE